MAHLVALSTIDTHPHATELARALLDARLAACVNIVGPITSLYRWQGAVQQDPEYLLVIKTTAEQQEALQAKLLELHPYETPEFLVLEVKSGAPPYLDWISASVGAR